MATAVTITSVVREEAPSTRILVNFSNGTQREYNDRAQMMNAAREADTNVQLVQDMAIAYWLARDPEATESATIIEGKVFDFDLGRAAPIRVVG